MKIANQDVTVPVSVNARVVTIDLILKAGKTRLQTWLMDDRGNSRGAYYVYVKRL